MIALEGLERIEFIHSKYIIHRDINYRNLFHIKKLQHLKNYVMDYLKNL